MKKRIEGGWAVGIVLWPLISCNCICKMKNTNFRIFHVNQATRTHRISIERPKEGPIG